MVSIRQQYGDDNDYPLEEDTAVMLDPDEAAEEVQDDGDASMDSGEESNADDEVIHEVQLENDSSAHFDLFKDGIFSIAQHPLHHAIVAIGGSEGEDAGGIGYLFDSTPAPSPVLPVSYQTSPGEIQERKTLGSLFTLEGHTDSIAALAFTLPSGKFLLSAGLDGKLRAYTSQNPQAWRFLAETQEVDEINWLSSCPNPIHQNVVALGANDGSVWIYKIDSSTKDAPLQIIQSFFLHTGSCTAGAWTPDGKMLATVSEDGSLYVWDVFGDAAADGVLHGDGGQAVVALTTADQRFAVEGGLFSVATSPSGAFLAVGGANGAIKVVSIPRLSAGTTATPAGGQTSSKAKGGKQGSKAASATTGGQIIADLNVQSDGIETLAFAPPPLTLLAAGSVDGSIALYDAAHRFAVRRHIREAHENHSVVKVEFVKSAASGGWLLTSCGMDGVVRRWDARGGTASANSGLLREWKGHRGEGQGGGVLGFVQGTGERIVTAGDDGLALVFEAPLA